MSSRRSRAAILARRAEESPSAYLAWLPLQWSFMHDDAKIKLIRAGNQWFGKTEALCAELRWRCTGTHPYLTGLPEPPIEAVVVSPTAEHSRKFQKKFWKGLDKRLVDPRTELDPTRGFRGVQPNCIFKNGSIVRFRSGKSGGLALSGDTLHLAIIDEPTRQAIYEEIERRVSRLGGHVLIGLTPRHAPEPLTWLQGLVTAGVVSEHHARLEPEQMIPVGHASPLIDPETGGPLDAEWIARQRARVLSHEASIILDGEWEVPPEGQSFPAFDWRPGGSHVTSEWDPGLEVSLYVGIDHGEREFKQCACLVAVYGGGMYPKVHVLDEYTGDGLTTHDQDARGILAMLERWGIRWGELRGVTGDRDHDVSRRSVYSVTRKSNSRMQAEIARELGVPYERLKPTIRYAKRGSNNRGRLRFGYAWLHEQMLRPDHFRVQARCVHTIESLRRHAWQDDGTKDIIDALRYALEPEIMRIRSNYGRSVVRVGQ